MKSNNTYAKVTELDGRPRLSEAIPLAFQHVVAMIIGGVTPAIILSGVIGANTHTQIMLIQASLIISGITTLLQLFPPHKALGSRLPVIMGVSFAYIPLLISLGAQYDLPTILGAQLIGGLAVIVVGLCYKKVMHFFPTLITGTVVFSIGLSLYPTAVNYMSGGVGAADFGSPKNWGVAIFTLAVVVFVSYFTKGILSKAAILIGMIAGYILALILGMVSFDNVASASWFQVPPVGQFGMKFVPSAIAAMVILCIIEAVEAIGDLTSTACGGLDREPTEQEISGGIVGNGICSVLGSIFGGLPTATFSQNVGIVILTKVVNRYVIGLAAVLILIAGLIPKAVSILTTIPSCVLGGATISVFSMIAMTGIKLIQRAGFTGRTMMIVGGSVALGSGITQETDCLQFFPQWFITIFGGSSVVVTTLTAILLNLILPQDNEGEEE